MTLIKKETIKLRSRATQRNTHSNSNCFCCIYPISSILIQDINTNNVFYYFHSTNKILIINIENKTIIIKRIAKQMKDLWIAKRNMLNDRNSPFLKHMGGFSDRKVSLKFLIELSNNFMRNCNNFKHS